MISSSRFGAARLFVSIAIFLVYKHWRYISFDIQICQPQNKRSHCFKSQLGSGWHINNNGWRHEKHRYSTNDREKFSMVSTANVKLKYAFCKFSSQFQWNVSQTGTENKENYQLKRCDLDITPNFHDYPTKKSMVLVRRMNVLILGMKGWMTSSDLPFAVSQNAMLFKSPL